MKMPDESPYLQSPFEAEEGILTQIGTIISVWGAINNMLRSLTAERLDANLENADAILNRFNGESGKIDFLLALVDVKNFADDPALIACLQRIKELVPERNVIVHGGPVFKASLDGGEFHFQNFKKPAKTRNVNAIPLLREHLKKLRVAGGSLYSIVYAAQISALEDKPID